MQFGKIVEWRGSYGFAISEGATSYRRLYIHVAEQMVYMGDKLVEPDETFKKFKHIRVNTMIAFQEVVPSENNTHTNRARKWAPVVHPDSAKKRDFKRGG